MSGILRNVSASSYSVSFRESYRVFRVAVMVTFVVRIVAMVDGVSLAGVGLRSCGR